MVCNNEVCILHTFPGCLFRNFGVFLQCALSFGIIWGIINLLQAHNRNSLRIKDSSLQHWIPYLQSCCLVCLVLLTSSSWVLSKSIATFLTGLYSVVMIWYYLDKTLRDKSYTVFTALITRGLLLLKVEVAPRPTKSLKIALPVLYCKMQRPW